MSTKIVSFGTSHSRFSRPATSPTAPTDPCSESLGDIGQQSKRENLVALMQIEGHAGVMPPLTLNDLCREAGSFAARESSHWEPALYGVTDGKAVGTYIEHKFQAELMLHYTFTAPNSALGIDFPSLAVDMKVTSVAQPQSSCPYRNARQKIYGLGYNLLIFVYEKLDDPKARAGNLNFLHVVFVEAAKTGDFQMTTGLQKILQNDGNSEDLVAFMRDKALPVDDIEAAHIAEELLKTPPETGYLTISNALQWRLQYKRVITQAGSVPGILRLTTAHTPAPTPSGAPPIIVEPTDNV